MGAERRPCLSGIGPNSISPSAKNGKATSVKFTAEAFYRVAIPSMPFS